MENTIKNYVVYCTVPNEFIANLIANTLVEENLAACVNIIENITSVYKWEGRVQNDKELLLIIKTQKSKFEPLKEKILSLHEYSTPEIIALPIEEGFDGYQKWIIRETT